jgi:nucleoside-diphosphate-sugar epimerase
LLARNPDERVLVTVRPTQGRSAQERIADLLARMYGDEAEREKAARRVTPLEFDLASDEPTLSEDLRQKLAGCRCRVIHGAANVALDHSLEDAENINVGGTRRMLDLARAIAETAALERFGYIGTAFVAGEREGVILEEELDVGQRFHNTYEQSKCQAEALVRSYRDRLPISIFRPSVIAGHSVTGFTTSFKTLYWPLKVFTSGLVVCIPGDPDSFYDLVPVDFVAESLLHILERPDSVGRCYHLTAGRTVSLDRAVRLTAEFFGVRRIPPYVPMRLFYTIVRPILYVVLWGRWREVLTKSKVIVPYLMCKLEFDKRNTAAALEGSGIMLPDVENYLKTVYGYVKESGWGRKPLPPAVSS